MNDFKFAMARVEDALAQLREAMDELRRDEQSEDALNDFDLRSVELTNTLDDLRGFLYVVREENQ